LELPGRTVGKILKRMNIGCSNCGWKKSTGDIHHINGKKIKDYNNHKNLCYLCPNCHRLVHNKKIYKENLISLDIFIGNKWKYFYNIKM
jgi:DNA-directed RNA polymerase subunit RPC12/RpoP